jgi:hypothetical protein
MLKKHIFLLSIQTKKVTFFRKACNELLIIRYLISSVTVPLQLLATAVYSVNVTKTLQFTAKK